ncbi:MAG: hypothetical protein Q7S65_06605 [Nanoarchaeota archaeon]|nr:hypothetical protein [Nanoarchaeota archaeon]
MDNKLNRKLRQAWEEAERDMDIDENSDIPVSEKKVKDMKKRTI